MLPYLSLVLTRGLGIELMSLDLQSKPITDEAISLTPHHVEAGAVSHVGSMSLGEQ